MKYSSSRRGNLARVAALVGLWVLGTAWAAPRPADELDREAVWSIPAAPLGSALLQFASQSGLQVAADEARVGHLRSGALNGRYSVRAALDHLLQGTGLGFYRVGAGTLAIRAAPAAQPLRAVSAARADRADTPPPAAAFGREADTGSDPGFSDILVTALKPPAESELTGEALSSFISHHATVHYVNTGVRGNLARWRGGRSQTICPATQGLDPGYDALVTARMRELTTRIGAPLDPDPQCKNNVKFVFTDDPQAAMNEVVTWASRYFRTRFAVMRRLLAFNGDHAIQGWYMTASGGDRVLNVDFGLLKLHLQPVWPRITPQGLNDYGDMSGIAAVVLVVDTTKTPNYAIGTIADYLAVLTLSVAQSPDTCDALPSVLDIMTPGCRTEARPMTVTPGDIAFLHALYYKNSGVGSSPSRVDIQAHMLEELKGAPEASHPTY